jgi:hypothetical protein
VASVDLFWNHDEGFDIHLLPGETSSSLLDLLVIREDTTPPKFSLARTPPADVDSITFTPNFLGVGAVPENGGVKVDTDTGVVSVNAAPTLKSFVIEATVKTKAPASKTLDPIPIRVLVHTAIQDIWLTPSPLTIRQGSDGERLTLLARFDDQTIGDITRRPGTSWASSDAAKIAVAANGALSAVTNPANVTITATHAAHVATADVVAKEPWSTPVAAALVPGSAGVAKAAKVPNILFLSEGFTAAEKPKFEALVRAVVKRLQSTESLRPYDLAKGSLNFWTAFVPSRERGTSATYDLKPVVRARLFGEEIKAPVKPPVGAAFTLENLIYQVGLPTPADAGVAYDAAIRNWLARYGLAAANIAAPVYAEWQTLSRHLLANEVDSAFGIAMGQRPAMHRPRVPRVPGLNPLRTTRKHLDSFLQNLTLNAGGPRIGAIWATQDPAAPIPDPAGAGLPVGLKAGQDRPLVFMICGGARRGGAQPDGLILGTLRSENEVRLDEVIGTPQFDLDPYDLPTSASLEFVAMVAHEAAHAFGLKDEYGEFNTPLRIPTAEEKDLKSPGNVQAASALEKSAADPTLDPVKLGSIKWLWPRIEQAGVLADKPNPNGAAFDVKLVRGHASGFKPGNIVRLRLRPLVDHPQPSGRLRVTAVTGDVVTVAPFAGVAIVRDDWPAGSILMRPVRGAATAADPDGPDLPLVAPIISAHLSASGIPLDQKPPPPAPACTKDDSKAQTAQNLPAGLPVGRPRFKAQIVGLWDGGDRYYCGVYHPSGACVMRALQVPGAPLVTYLFCPVCRYFLVDRLDPTKHRVIDRDYQKRYPQP